jgi:hypothetical protein
VNLPMTDDVRTAQGGPAPWPELFQRKNLLVLFAREGDLACDRAIEGLEATAPTLDEEHAVPIVVYDRMPSQSPEGLTVLVDPERHLAGRLGANDGQLLVVDKFFEVLKSLDVHRIPPEHAVPEAIGWLDLSEMSCPECGVGTW